MTRKRKIVIIVSALVLVVLSGRYIQVLFSRYGGGVGADSPDGRYEASVTDFLQERYWGGTRCWTEFSVHTSQGKIVWRMVLEHPDKNLDWRTFGKIRWKEDPLTVVFEHKDGEDFSLQVVRRIEHGEG